MNQSIQMSQTERDHLADQILFSKTKLSALQVQYFLSM